MVCQYIHIINRWWRIAITLTVYVTCTQMQTCKRIPNIKFMSRKCEMLNYMGNTNVFNWQTLNAISCILNSFDTWQFLPSHHLIDSACFQHRHRHHHQYRHQYQVQQNIPHITIHFPIHKRHEGKVYKKKSIYVEIGEKFKISSNESNLGKYKQKLFK